MYQRGRTVLPRFRVLGDAEAVEPRSRPDRLHVGCLGHLRQEGRERIPPGDLQPCLSEKAEPVRVVNLCAWSSLLPKQLDRDLLEFPAAQLAVHCFQGQLRSETEHLVNVAQQPCGLSYVSIYGGHEIVEPLRLLLERHQPCFDDLTFLLNGDPNVVGEGYGGHAATVDVDADEVVEIAAASNTPSTSEQPSAAGFGPTAVAARERLSIESP